jgi:hypothetical protein
MSILGSIVEAIFGGPARAETPPPSAPKASPVPGTAGSKTSGTPQPGTAGSKTSGTPQPAEVKVAVNAPAGAVAGGAVDVAAQMDKIQAASKEKGLDWRKSIVDLMKLLDLDSSLKARKALAKELSYTGDTKNSSEMNQWLHKQVMIKLAENGGKVPAELKD